VKCLYIDAGSGVSGDMLLGALVDLGVPLAFLQGTLDGLSAGRLKLASRQVVRGGITCTKVDVEFDDGHRHRGLHDIAEILTAGALDEAVREKALGVFRRLAEAEAAVHGVDVERVHFHEVGAMDAIADIVGVVAGLNYLQSARVFAGPVNVGAGSVTCAHGVLPVPAPATLRLLSGWTCYADGPAMELTTPTGAALVSTVAEHVPHLPGMSVDAVGYGAGYKDPEKWPNAVRLIVGELCAEEHSPAAPLVLRPAEG
jgi:uncharacterized protein (TIGR00299 family) protein